MASRNRGKTKPTIGKLSREWPTLEENEALRNTLAGDDRAIVTAILGASLLEYQLETMLRKRLRHRDDETWEAMTGRDGPLHSFFAKITAGYAAGLYNEILRDGLHTVRKIRNVFAHGKKLIPFKNETIVKELRAVTLPEKTGSHLYRRLHLVTEVPNPRLAFVTLCLTIENQLIKRERQNLRTRMKRPHRTLSGVRMPPPQRAGLLSEVWSRDRQTVDPNSTILGSSQSTPRRREPKSPRNGGK